MTVNNNNLSQIAKLLSTRLCHDLAGPFGGVSNGVEFLSDTIDDPEMAKQSLSLLQLSSEEGAAKLQMFRQAYGIINQIGGNTEIALLKQIFKDYFQHSKTNVIWDELQITALDHRTRQILTNLVLIASSTIISGGDIQIAVDDSNESTSLTVISTGDKLKYDDDLEKILTGTSSIDEITPHTIQAYFAKGLSDEYGSQLVHQITEHSFSLTVANLP